MVASTGNVQSGQMQRQIVRWWVPGTGWGANGDRASLWGEENVLELEIKTDFEKFQSRGPIWMKVPATHMCLSS